MIFPSALALTVSILPSNQALDLSSIKSHRWRIQPCSAMTGSNLVEGLDWVVEDVSSRSADPSLCILRRVPSLSLGKTSVDSLTLSLQAVLRDLETARKRGRAGKAWRRGRGIDPSRDGRTRLSPFDS
jgi:hypothetical protein